MRTMTINLACAVNPTSLPNMIYRGTYDLSLARRSGFRNTGIARRKTKSYAALASDFVQRTRIVMHARSTYAYIVNSFRFAVA